MSKLHKAFTLVELLVVIGIIALLIGILLPTLARARDAGNSAKCLANMKQAAMAVTFYMNENRGRYLPPYRMPERTPNYVPQGSGGGWNGAPYFFTWLSGHYFKGDPKVWICPTESNNTAFDASTRFLRLYTSERDSVCSYFLNRALPKLEGNYANRSIYPDPYDHNNYFTPIPVGKIKNPTKTMIYGESTMGTALTYASVTDWTSPARIRFEHRKRNAMSICFADGHAEQLERADVLLRAGEAATPVPVRIRELWFGHPTYEKQQIVN